MGQDFSEPPKGQSIQPDLEMKRNPTEEEYKKVAEAIFANNRVEATSMYLSITECGLTEAQEFIKTLTAELNESKPERFVRKKQGKRNWLSL